MVKPAKNPAMVLQELTVKRNLPPPEYEIIHSITGSHENRFDYRVRVGGIEALGTGTSKQIGKHEAALKALLLLKDEGIYDPVEDPVEEFKAAAIHKAAGHVPGSPLKSSLNCIGPLKDLCVENKIEDPVFTELSDVGPPHAREFTYECKIGSVKTVATGNTKKMTKQLAAKEMIEKIKFVLPDIILEAPRQNEEMKTLPQSEKDHTVLEIYNKMYGNVIVDKKVPVKNFAFVFKKLLEVHELTMDQFTEDFEEKTEDALVRILQKIGLKHQIIVLQDTPGRFIQALSINCDVSFGTMALGETEAEAKEELIKNTFETLDYFFHLDE